MPCFCSSAKIRAFMKTKGWSTDCPTGGSGHPPGYKHLIAFFLRQVQALAKKHGRKPCGWQEIFDHYGGDTPATPTPPFDGIDPETVVYDWLAPGWGWSNPGTITAKGFRAVSTLGLYVSSDQDNTNWMKYFESHPLESSDNATAPHGRGWFNVTSPEARKLMIGAEACLWGEHTNAAVMNVRVWPRAAGMAEALWSGHEGANVTEAYPRLLRHRCRMMQRGVPVTPLQPGFC